MKEVNAYVVTNLCDDGEMIYRVDIYNGNKKIAEKQRRSYDCKSNERASLIAMQHTINAAKKPMKINFFVDKINTEDCINNVDVVNAIKVTASKKNIEFSVKKPKSNNKKFNDTKFE